MPRISISFTKYDNEVDASKSFTIFALYSYGLDRDRFVENGTCGFSELHQFSNDFKLAIDKGMMQATLLPIRLYCRYVGLHK